MKALIIATTVVAGITFSAANAAPLPEARPDDAGFSQAGLKRLEDFFAREIAAKRVPGAVVAIARDGKLVHYKAYGQLDPDKGHADAARCGVRAGVDDETDGRGRRADADGARPPAAAGKTRGLLSGLRRNEGGRAAAGRLAEAGRAGVADCHSRPLSPHLRPDVWRTSRQLEPGRASVSGRHGAGAGGRYAGFHRSHHKTAAGASAVDGIRIRFFDRRARRCGRKGQRAAARRLSGEACAGSRSA